jgi:hypothetical protein
MATSLSINGRPDETGAAAYATELLQFMCQSLLPINQIQRTYTNVMTKENFCISLAACWLLLVGSDSASDSVPPDPPSFQSCQCYLRHVYIARAVIDRSFAFSSRDPDSGRLRLLTFCELSKYTVEALTQFVTPVR